jgi:hypothetical protein
VKKPLAARAGAEAFHIYALNHGLRGLRQAILASPAAPGCTALRRRFTMISGMPQHHPETSQDQLLELYWDRASVKRELASLRRERYTLLDRLKQQEGAIHRAREQLEGLERLLTNPLSAANAMVYFQLRRLWRTCSQRVGQFGQELEQQRVHRESAALEEAEMSRRRRRLNAIRERVEDLGEKRRLVTEEMQQVESRLAGLSAAAKLVKGPKLRKRLERLGKNGRVLDERVAEFAELREKIEGEPLPQSEALSLESRRLLNTTVIALAQQLVVHFSGDDLAKLAKATTERPVADMKFGDRGDCDRLVEGIRARIKQLKQDRSIGDKVRRRADQLAPQLTYRSETDTVPAASSVASIPLRVGEEAVDSPAGPPLDVNVLADDYWEINAALR